MTNKTITRTDLVATLNTEVGLSRAECSDLLESVLKEITATLAIGETVKIHRFATFIPHQKNARIGRNPKTREEVTIPPRRVILFRPSPELRAKVIGAGE